MRGEDTLLGKNASLGSIMSLHVAGQPKERQGTQIVLKITVPSQNIQKAVRVMNDDIISDIKDQLLDKISKDTDGALNYGLFLPGTEGKEGKFLDEFRAIQNYRLADNTQLEFRTKFKQGIQVGSKAYEKENNPKHWKKFMEAVRDCKIDEIKSRIAKGMDPNFIHEDGLTPLTLAVLNNDRDCIKALIEVSAILDFRCKLGVFSGVGPATHPTAANAFGSTWFTPLHVAAAENKLVSLQTLLYFGASPHVKDSAGLTPLYHACANGNVEIVRWLLIWGANNVKNDKMGIELEINDSQERTAMHHACSNGHPQVVQFLVDYGADIEASNSVGNTPLHSACTKPLGGQLFKECAKILLTYGADKERRNRTGQSPSQIALMSGNIELSDYIKKWSGETAEPPSFEHQVETAKLQWQNIKKMMTIGTSNTKFVSGTMSQATAAVALSETVDGTGSLSSGRRSNAPSRPGIMSIFGEAKTSQSSLPKADSKGSIAETANGSTFVLPSGPAPIIPPKRNRSASASSHMGPPTILEAPSFQPVSPVGLPPNMPPPQFAAPPPIMMGMTAPPPPMSATGTVRERKMPPPPPPALPGMAQIPGMPPGMPPPPSMAGFPGMPPHGMPPMPIQMGMAQNPMDIMAQLAKIDEEKRKLEAEVERLKQQMMMQMQFQQQQHPPMGPPHNHFPPPPPPQ